MRKTPLKANPETTRAWRDRSQQKQRDRARCSRADTDGTPPRTPIKVMSDKRKIAVQTYGQLREEFLKKNPKCWRCGAKATDLHHQKGRDGKLYLDTEHFISLCRPCHDWIPKNRDAAAAEGLIVSRHTGDAKADLSSQENS